MPVRCLFAVLLALPRAFLADLPVHCLRHQVVGEWEFTLGTLKSHRSPCGHRRPDDPNVQPKLNFLESEPTTSLKLSLKDPNTAIAEDGTNGTWTMIYDEAWEVSIGDAVFLAFSNFEFVQDAEKGRTNVSHCDATQIGWYRDTARKQWGCYVGRKKGVALPTASPGTPAPLALVAEDTRDDTAPEVSLASVALQGPSAPRDQDEAQDEVDDDDSDAKDPAKPLVAGSAGYDAPMESKWQNTVATSLNFLQLGWEAVAYDLFTGKTPRELNRFAGVRHSRPVPHGGFLASQSAVAASKSFPSFLGVRSRVQRSSGEDQFDWQNKDGKDWLQPVVSQGDCGSCYAISTVHMLTARNRIAKNDASQAAFSVSFPLYCSEYNQGCDGGYGFLETKWSEDVGLVPESCAPLSEGGGSCKALTGCNLGSTRFRATNHHYVGGYYGGSEENVIREELVKNGPVVMSFEPKEDFMYYKNGVYKSAGRNIHQEWEQVDHAVLLTGYGEHKGQPYWRLQNSWGNDWGEDGFFRMARGFDESGCESIVVAAEVVEESSNPILDDFLSQL